MISCISRGSSHFFNCRSLPYVNWRQLTSRLTISPGNIPVIARVSVNAQGHVLHQHVYVSSPICHQTPSYKGVAVIFIKKREWNIIWSLAQKTLEHMNPSPRASSLRRLTLLCLLFNCLSLTRTQRRSGGHSYSAGSLLPLKWNDLISQLSILKDIYKTHYATNAEVW